MNGLAVKVLKWKFNFIERIINMNSKSKEEFQKIILDFALYCDDKLLLPTQKLLDQWLKANNIIL